VDELKETEMQGSEGTTFIRGRCWIGRLDTGMIDSAKIIHCLSLNVCAFLSFCLTSLYVIFGNFETRTKAGGEKANGRILLRAMRSAKLARHSLLLRGA
jgi:hypothetical protein